MSVLETLQTVFVVIVIGALCLAAYHFTQSSPGQITAGFLGGLFASNGVNKALDIGKKLFGGGATAAGAAETATAATGASAGGGGMIAAATTAAGAVGTAAAVVGAGAEFARMVHTRPNYTKDEIPDRWVPTLKGQCGYSKAKADKIGLGCPDGYSRILDTPNFKYNRLPDTWTVNGTTYKKSDMKFMRRTLLGETKEAKTRCINGRFVGVCVKNELKNAMEALANNKDADTAFKFANGVFCGQPSSSAAGEKCPAGYVYDGTLKYRAMGNQGAVKISEHWDPKGGARRSCGLRTRYAVRCKKSS